MKSFLKVFSLLACFVVAGCAEKAPQTEAKPKPQPAVVKETEVTQISGRLDLSRLPAERNWKPEILVIESVEAGLDEQFDEIEKYFYQEMRKAKQNAHKQVSSAVATLSKAQSDMIKQQLNALIQKMPAEFAEQGSQRISASRDSIYTRYKGLLESIQVEQLVEGLNQINEQMQRDVELLNELRESSNTKEANQAIVNMNWLAEFSEYMQGYRNVVAQYDNLRRTAAHEAAQSGQQTRQIDPDSLHGWLEKNGESFRAEIFKRTLDSQELDTTGAFQLDGKGQLVLSLTYEGTPLFFRLDGDESFAPISGKTEKLIIVNSN